MKIAASMLCLLGLSSVAVAETCSGFETRLNTLATQVQQMIDIVDAMAPVNAPSCGGVVGAKIDVALLIETILTGVASPLRYDTEWCCKQCMQKTTSDGCKYWSLQIAPDNKARCQLYYDNPVRPADVPVGSPGGFLFMSGLGIGVAGVGSKRVSGVIPEEGRWGGETNTGDLTNMSNYMYNSQMNGASGSATMTWNGVTNDPAAPMAEGFEMCDSVGAFKPAGHANNGNIVTTYSRHPLECCSLCVRRSDMGGNQLTNPCVLWAYNYDPKKRQCYTRDNTYGYLPAAGIETEAGMTAYQAGAVCAAVNAFGDPRYHPDGVTQCTGTFEARRWSAGTSRSRSMDELEFLATGM